jgi:hypothetical protein
MVFQEMGHLLGNQGGMGLAANYPEMFGRDELLDSRYGRLEEGAASA